jgi:hypothetical protein
VRRTEWEFLRDDLLAVKPSSKILHSNFLADANTFALGIDQVFERHPYIDAIRYMDAIRYTRVCLW